MSARPLLVFPQATPASRRKRSMVVPPLTRPSVADQAARVGPKLDQLLAEASSQRVRLQASPLGVFPEDTVVFEVADSVAAFLSAVRKTEGLDWLAETFDPDMAPEFWSRRDHPVPKTLYFVSATERGQRELLSLWRRYKDGRPFPHGQAAWREVFSLLVDVRLYGRADRLERTGALASWEERMLAGDLVVRAEVELWARPRGGDRAVAVRRAVEDIGGRVLDGPMVLEEAGVCLVLAELPAGAVGALRDHTHAVDLADLPEVRCLRAAGQAIAQVPTAADAVAVPGAAPRAGEAVIAVLDGLPIENHVSLAGAVVVDDPEDWAATTPVDRRHHGTGVVSAVLWRDLDHPAPLPSRPIYVRPVLRWDGSQEVSPAERLFADVLHGAVARLFEGPRVAPEVAVINLSVGVINLAFDGISPSALARTLDVLAWRYKVLFVVSAGNYDLKGEEVAATRSTLESEPRTRHEVLVNHARDTVDDRRMLSPAELINGLTVGALDEDEGGNGRHGWFPAWPKRGPALYSRVGTGVRRGMKPELLAAGGHQPLQFDPGGAKVRLHAFEHVLPAGVLPGVGVAVAGPSRPGQDPLRGRRYERGTSFAAPRVTRAAALLSDELDGLVAETGRSLFAEAPRAVWLKCLLVHAASRRELHDWAEPAVRGADTTSRNRDRDELLNRFVGFGFLDEARLGVCTPHRVTILGGGELNQDEAHVYELPLPLALRERGSFRRELRITVAWLTPVAPDNVRYRGALLALEPLRTPGFTLNEGREVRSDAEGRGTVLHRVLAGRGRAAYDAGDVIRLELSCRADGIGRLDEAVPYAIAVSLEVQEDLGVDIYQELRTALRVRTRVGVKR